jgi:Tat protein translocase TatB subunit
LFDIGWSEIGLIAGAAIVLTKPEDMPRMLYNFGKIVRKIKIFTGDIQKSIDKIVNEAEVDEVARNINTKIGGPNLQFEIDRQIAEEERKEAASENAPSHPKSNS